jgi:queuine/archaeosine tRNA-ribosyltransferase
LPGLSNRSTVAFVREHFVGRSRIWFDSGGYFVQQGEIAFEDLYRRLLRWYQENEWAHVYVLPDYVPSSDLTAEEVEARVRATIAVARLFSHDLPPAIRERGLPVVQGHTREQIKICVETYVDLGYQAVGFGSFDTTGVGKDVNLMTRRALANLSFLQELAHRYGLRTHAFGVGSPALIPTLHALGIASFDSSCWIRTAGFGNVLLPFLGRRNVSHGMLREVGGRAYNEDEFLQLKAVTGHDCPFCASFERLQKNRLDQALHNLLVIRETAALLDRGERALPESIRALIDDSRYTRLLPVPR